MPTPSRADDEALLTMLDLRDHAHLSLRKIASRMGMTVGQVQGQTNRVDLAHEPGAEHRDGSLPRRWWERRTP